MTYFAYDAIAVLAFAIFARMAHKSEPFTFVNILDTYWPFLIGVLIAWVYLRARHIPGNLFSSGAIVWACTVVSGLGIWAVNNGRTPHISFIIVATVMSGLLLMAWRVAARLSGKK